VVDYVVIDKNPTPLENIRLIEPDYFAKGSSNVDRHAGQDGGGGGSDQRLWRRDHFHARRHRLFLLEPDRSRAAAIKLESSKS